ncbi:MAG TPA: Stp1/IreP family PP2C-type Ser/Thr phosphatase [Terracidiphilus sp.]|nr:Stp1/IreP family PP2C-type Ser/Thr phosphatase [Terracidiphilus sp.]
MSSALVQYAAAALSDRGRKRSGNEDAYGISLEDGAFVVCDGMGGAAAGEVASAIAVDEVMRRLKSRAVSDPLPAAAEAAIEAANLAVYTRSQSSRKLSGMGTTLVALVVEQQRAWVLNVGDSRCYLRRGGALRQITVDHSLVEEQVRSGRIKPSEAERSPLRNVITRALGTQSSVTSDVFPVEVEPGDLFLLCSDGLTRELSDPIIASLLALDLPLDRLCERLVNAANRAGGHDNITCLLVRAEA